MLPEDRQYAADIAVSIPEDLPAGLAIAYAWVHEAARLDHLASDNPAHVELEIGNALAAHAYDVTQDAELPALTREALTRLAAWLNETAPAGPSDEEWADREREEAAMRADYWRSQGVR